MSYIRKPDRQALNPKYRDRAPDLPPLDNVISEVLDLQQRLREAMRDLEVHELRRARELGKIEKVKTQVHGHGGHRAAWLDQLLSGGKKVK